MALVQGPKVRKLHSEGHAMDRRHAGRTDHCVQFHHGGQSRSLVLVNGVVAGIGAVYVITLSVAVTGIAAAAAVVLAALDMISNR